MIPTKKKQAHNNNYFVVLLQETEWTERHEKRKWKEQTDKTGRGNLRQNKNRTESRVCSLFTKLLSSVLSLKYLQKHRHKKRCQPNDHDEDVLDSGKRARLQQEGFSPGYTKGNRNHAWRVLLLLLPSSTSRDERLLIVLLIDYKNLLTSGRLRFLSN